MNQTKTSNFLPTCSNWFLSHITPLLGGLHDMVFDHLNDYFHLKEFVSGFSQLF
jgi:hypothetical protein